MQRHLYEHFTLPGHSGFLHDVPITLIDETDPSWPTKGEDNWIGTLKTKAPMGNSVCKINMLLISPGKLCDKLVRRFHTIRFED